MIVKVEFFDTFTRYSTYALFPSFSHDTWKDFWQGSPSYLVPVCLAMLLWWPFLDPIVCAPLRPSSYGIHGKPIFRALCVPPFTYDFSVTVFENHQKCHFVLHEMRPIEWFSHTVLFLEVARPAMTNETWMISDNGRQHWVKNDLRASQIWKNYHEKF